MANSFSTILCNALKTHLPAPLKRFLKGLRNRVRQRQFVSELPERNNDIAPMDVLFQAGDFLAGGLENVVLDLLATFREAGISVALLVLGQPGEAAKKAEQSGFPVFIRSYSDANYVELLDKLKPGLLLAHYSILGVGLAAQRKIPVIQVIHNSYVWFSDQERADFQASAQSTDVFIAVSRWVAEYSIKRLGLPSEKVCVIENGIDLEKFQRPGLLEEGGKLRRELGFTEADVIFLSVASVARQKNPLGLVRAFHAAAASCPDAKLALLGPVYDPSLYQAVMDYCAKHDLQGKIFYLGAASDPAPYYAMADVFTHAAFFEGGQLSFLEVLAMNLPCVSTAVGFCMNREEQSGMYICPPPVDFYAYNGTMAGLAPTEKSVHDLAGCMREAYAERKRPDLNGQDIERLDRKFSYEAYVEKISPLMKKTGFKTEQ